MIADLDQDVSFQHLQDYNEKKLSFARSASCRSAVMFEDELQPQVMERMLADMQELSVLTCAHGRPVYWEISFADLNKKFGRCA